MGSRFLAIILVIQLVLSQIAFAQWEIIERNGLRFALVPSEKVVELAMDIQELKTLKRKNADLMELSVIQENQLESMKMMMSTQSQTTELYKIKEGVYTRQVTYLTETVEAEFKENERLRLSRPSPLYWTAFGGIITFGLIGLTAYALESVR